MKTYFKSFFTLLIALLCYSNSYSQSWVALMNASDNASFNQAQKEFEKYWKGKEVERGKGYKPFLRWVYSRENHMKADGSFAKAGNNVSAFTASPLALTSPSGNWTSLGPNTTTGGYAGLGRISSVAFHPTDANTIYAGAGGGGVWKTTNGGTSWLPLTDGLGSLGASSIVVEPTNPQIVYLATGDGDARDNPSVGVMKSLDGGTTWNMTGLNWIHSELKYIYKLLRHPSDPNILFAATTVGIYKTIDAGASWVLSSPNLAFYDIEVKPGDGTIYYASATTSSNTWVYKSSDTGNSWTVKHTLTDAERCAIAVSPANPSYVALLYGKYSDSGFRGFYSSTNSGETFNLISSTPNLLGWNSNGGDAGGQAWYDLTLAIDPTNASIIYVGGVNTWKSTNGGSTWKINTMWTSSGRTPVVHADKHAMEWQNNTTLFQGNDGGLYKTTNGGSAWTHLSNTMVISQMYRIGIAQTNSSLIAGLQDNGTKSRSTTNTWTDRIGGDGMDCAINPTNASIMFGELYYGDLKRSTNGGGTWSTTHPTSESGAWVTPFALAPSSPTTIYLGYKNIFKSTNNGTGWTALTTGRTVNTRSLAIAPSNANVVYFAEDALIQTGGNKMYKTTNGATFAAITNPSDSGRINSITVDNTNSNTVWVSMSGYHQGKKIFKSTDGGTSWTNISGSLPNLPANCVTFMNNSNGGVYVAMDVAVYYRDNSMSDWILFNAGLPNVEVTDLDIQYTLGKLRVATFGRGVWESDFYGVSAIANIKNSPVSAKELEASTFSIYPNPVRDVLNAEFYATEAGNTKLVILDMGGRISQQNYSVYQTRGINKIQINVSNLPSGMYYLGDGKGKSTRFIKQ